MYSGTLGTWRVETYGGPPSASDINAVEKEGYEFVCVCATVSTFYAYYRYRGGRHPNTTR